MSRATFQDRTFFLALAMACTVATAAFAQSHNAPSPAHVSLSQVEPPPPDCPPDNDSTAFRHVTCWDGRRFILIDSREKTDYCAFRLDAAMTRCLPYDEGYARTGVIVGSYVDAGEGRRYFKLKMEDNGQVLLSEQIDRDGTGNEVTLHGLALLSDIDYIRNRYDGDTVWLKSRYGMSHRDDRSNDHVDYTGSDRVQIVGVRVGWYDASPVRVLFRSEDGSEWFVDVTVSHTNTDTIMRTSGQTFEQIFSTTAPESEKPAAAPGKSTPKRKKNR